MKCQCECPDYINIPSGPFTNTIHLFKEHNTILHGKKATCTCKECGAGLCKDCGYHVWDEEGTLVAAINPEALYAYCPVCAEEL